MQKMSAVCRSVSAEKFVIWQKLCAKCRAELEAQMRDKEDAKKRERAERLQEDLKLHKEAARYNPWGKDKPGSPGRVPDQPPSHSQSQVNCSKRDMVESADVLMHGICTVVDTDMCQSSQYRSVSLVSVAQDYAVHHSGIDAVTGIGFRQQSLC